MSLGCPKLLSGIRRSIAAAPLASRHARVISVSIVPGATALIRMLYSASSEARLATICRTAALDMLYTDMLREAPAVKAQVDAIWMIEPPDAAAMSRAAESVIRNEPRA